MARRKTHEEFVKELKFKNEKFHNHSFVLLGKYTSMKNTILCKCEIDGYEWNAYPANLLVGKGCPSCSSNAPLNTETFIKRLKKVNPNIKILEGYVSSRTKIKCLCSKCNTHFEAISNDLLLDRAKCPTCLEIEKSIKKKNAFEKELMEHNPHLHISDDFVFMGKKCTFICDECCSRFLYVPRLLRKSYSCPNCTTNSKMEYKIVQFLNDNHIVYHIHKTFKNLKGLGGGVLNYDFYLPDYNLLIEAQGLQHEKPIDYFGGQEQFEIQQEHDKRKRNYAKEHNVDLLEIWHWDYENIEQILSEKLNINSNEKSA